MFIRQLLFIKKTITLYKNKRLQNSQDNKKDYESFCVLSPPYKGLSIKKISFGNPSIDRFLHIKTHENITIFFYYEAEEDISDIYFTYGMMIDNYRLNINKGKGTIKITIKDVNLVSTYGSLFLSIVKLLREYIFSSVDSLTIFL